MKDIVISSHHTLFISIRLVTTTVFVAIFYKNSRPKNVFQL
jgi:hypothetical protein